MKFSNCNHSYVLDNKRLDEWIPEERMDLSKIEVPKKEMKTPVKDSKLMNGSRPSSPELHAQVYKL